MPISMTEISELLDQSWLNLPERRAARGLAMALLEVLIEELPGGDKVSSSSVRELLQDTTFRDAVLAGAENDARLGLRGSRVGGALLHMLTSRGSRGLLHAALQRARFPAETTGFFLKFMDRD